ncbi:MAG: hypothetical protein GXP55_21735 [Deltaproteobacteria bacterium]|nr:hypothetical protein [Deltaproteobacteria bacterium]
MSPRLRRRVLQGVLALGVALAALHTAAAQPVHIIERAGGVVYVDAGSADGIVAGESVSFAHGDQTIRARVVAVTAHTAAVALTPDSPQLSDIPLPRRHVVAPERVRSVRRPAAAPPVESRWVDAYLPRVSAQVEDGEEVEEDDRSRVEVRGELAARLFAAGDIQDLLVGWDEAGLDSQLSVTSPSGLTWDHLIGVGLDAAPDVSFALFQKATPRFDAYLLRLGYAPTGSRIGLGIGRIMPLTGGGGGLVDGAEVNLDAAEGVRLSAFAGLAPNVGDLLPALRAPRAGVAFRVSGGELVRGRLRVGFDADGYRGALDRARASVDAGLELGRQLSASGRLVVDFANDAVGRRGPRPTRGSVELRGDHLQRRLRWYVGAGFDDPVYTRAIARQLPQEDLIFLPNAWADASVSARFGHGVGARVRARGYLGADGFSSLLITAGGSLRGRVLAADLLDLDLRVIRGSLAEGYGGSVRWDLPIAERTRLELGYSLDRLLVGPAKRVGYAQTLHVAGDQRLSLRTRASLALELGAGAGPLRALLFAQVAVRLGDVSRR